MAKLFKPTGEVINVSPKEKTFGLEELQGMVGGYIEIVAVGRELYVCDEEGKLKGKPINSLATNKSGRWFDPFVGDVLVCSRREIK